MPVRESAELAAEPLGALISWACAKPSWLGRLLGATTSDPRAPSVDPARKRGPEEQSRRRCKRAIWRAPGMLAISSPTLLRLPHQVNFAEAQMSFNELKALGSLKTIEQAQQTSSRWKRTLAAGSPSRPRLSCLPSSRMAAPRSQCGLNSEGAQMKLWHETSRRPGRFPAELSGVTAGPTDPG